MAMLKSINSFSSAPLAPGSLPASALFLVEIDRRVYRLAAEDILNGVTPGNLVGVTVPTTDPGVAGEVWLDGTTLKVSDGP